MKRSRLYWTLSILAALVVLAGCGSDSTCFDCGQCGFAGGPSTTNYLNASSGVGGEQRYFRINGRIKGKCTAVEALYEVKDGDIVRLDTFPRNVAWDPAEGRVTYPGTSVSVVVDQQDGAASLTATFMNGDQAFATLNCKIADQKFTCAKSQ